MIQEERSVFCEVIESSVGGKKKVHNDMWLIVSGYWHVTVWISRLN